MLTNLIKTIPFQPMISFNGDRSVPDILQYNISSDTICKVSKLSENSRGGLALKGKDSEIIYYFGGGRARRLIHKFNPATKLTECLITMFPTDVEYAAGFVPPNNNNNNNNSSWFIFNGKKRNILEFDPEHETVKIIGRDNLSFGNHNQIASTVSIYSEKDNKQVWLFPGHDEELTNHVMVFNTETKLLSPPPPHMNVNGPALYYTPATVSTGGRYGYIIGGIGNVPESDGSKYPNNGILR